MSYFTASETYLTVITLLAFFRGESVIKLSSEFLILVLRLILYLTGHDSVAILVEPATLFPCVGHRGLKLFLLSVSFPQPIINACR